MAQTWDEWRDELAGDLAALEDGDFINTTGPAIMRERGPGLFGRKRAPEVMQAGPVVLFLRMQDHLLMESVSAFPTRGEHPVSDEQRAELSEAGWVMPGHPDHVSVDGSTLHVYLPAAEPARAADLAARTYRILGVDDPADVERE